MPQSLSAFSTQDVTFMNKSLLAYEKTQHRYQCISSTQALFIWEVRDTISSHLQTNSTAFVCPQIRTSCGFNHFLLILL